MCIRHNNYLWYDFDCFFCKIFFQEIFEKNNRSCAVKYYNVWNMKVNDYTGSIIFTVWIGGYGFRSHITPIHRMHWFGSHLYCVGCKRNTIFQNRRISFIAAVYRYLHPNEEIFTVDDISCRKPYCTYNYRSSNTILVPKKKSSKQKTFS
jgi:hypothetical protein